MSMMPPKPAYKRGDVVLMLFPRPPFHPQGQQSGLLTDSVMITDNLATIADSEIHRVIGRLPIVQVPPLDTIGLGSATGTRRYL